MIELAINFLPHNRRYLMLHTLKQISKINNSYKHRFKIYIHDSGVDDYVKNILNDMNYEIVNHNSHDYISKIKYAINLQHKYSMKIDEDIFMNHHVLEYILDNISKLDDQNFIMTPVLSTGIPSTEMFIEDFCKDDVEDFYEMFTKTDICNLWGANYSSLNSHEPWNSERYYDKVNNLNHYYKGIHPIRINVNIQKKMIDVIRNNKHKLLEKQDYCIDVKKIPYICNSVFVIRTDEWKKIINDSNLYRDEYDEVPLNLYMKLFDKNVMFIRKANCVHPVYNTVDVFCHGMYNNLSKEWDKFLGEFL